MLIMRQTTIKWPDFKGVPQQKPILIWIHRGTPLLFQQRQSVWLCVGHQQTPALKKCLRPPFLKNPGSTKGGSRNFSWEGAPTLFKKKSGGTWVSTHTPVSAKTRGDLHRKTPPPLKLPLSITSLPGDAYYLSVTHNAEPQNAILIYPQC